MVHEPRKVMSASLTSDYTPEGTVSPGASCGSRALGLTDVTFAGAGSHERADMVLTGGPTPVSIKRGTSGAWVCGVPLREPSSCRMTP